MTSIGRAPLAGAILSPEPASGRFLLAAAAASLVWFGSAAGVSADPWVLDFETSNGTTALSHGTYVGNTWRTSTPIPGSDVNVRISTYGRSSSSLPPGATAPTNGTPATLSSSTIGAITSAAVANDGRKARVFNTNQNWVGTTTDDSIDTKENDLRIKTGNTAGTLKGFRYYTGSGDSDAMPGTSVIPDTPGSSSGSATPAVGASQTYNGKTFYNPGNVLVLDNTSTTDTDSHNDGGIFVFQFSAPVTLSSIDFLNTSFKNSENNGQYDYQQISFFNAAGQEIFVTPGSVNIASALDSNNSEGNGTSQLYVPYTGDNRWRRLTFNIENVTTMTIGCKYECAIDNLRGQRTRSLPEPAPLALLGLGVVGILAVRRRRA